MSELASHVEQSIERHRLFRAGQRILVAVSGGLDSMVLLRVLHELAPRHRWQLVVAHFNHQLRGRAGHADEALVRRTVQRLGWPCVVERGEVRQRAEQGKVSIEMAARELRHDFLARVARQERISTVALAHHADDQVELFFLRLLRGAGCEGLAGMKWRGPSPVEPRVALVRPLLDQDKESLRAFAFGNKIPFREDASNASLDIQRNRLRHELLPLLRQHYQPALSRVIRRLMTILGDTAEFVSAEAARRTSSPHPLPFAELPPALQRAVLREGLLRVGLTPDYEGVELLREAGQQPVSVGPDLRVRRDAQGVVSLEQLPVARFGVGQVEIDLAGQGTVEFDGVALEWSVLPGGRWPARVPGCEFFDAEQVGPRVCLRHWRKGDRFQPIGMPQAVKLQDWFTNQKVPRARRHELVLATTAAGEVFWVEGQRMTERFKVTPATRRRLRWAWRRPGAKS